MPAEDEILEDFCDTQSPHERSDKPHYEEKWIAAVEEKLHLINGSFFPGHVIRKQWLLPGADPLVRLPERTHEPR